MSRKELDSLCEARNTICAYCTAEGCEKCIVNQLVHEAFVAVSENEAEDEEIKF